MATELLLKRIIPLATTELYTALKAQFAWNDYIVKIDDKIYMFTIIP